MSAIAAIATPNVPGGIGIIRISGDDAFEIADKIFVSVSGKKLSSLNGYTAAFGHIYENQTIVDECVATVFKSPKSYTGENVVELSCHGGLFVIQKVLRAVLSNGAIAAQPGEFTKRAFLNGRIDLTEAESVMNIISANGAQALNAAITTLEGRLSKKLNTITKSLATASAGIAVWTDDPDEDVPSAHEDNIKNVLLEAQSNLTKLIDDFDCGKAITQGLNTVICGHPNVGKSTLMNCLSGSDVSIVTSVAGTTRDVVEETVRLGDIVLRLADTAGIHESSDEVEAIGIDRANKKIETADLVLAVFDGSSDLCEDDISLLKKCKDKLAVAIINKNDLPKKINESIISEYIPTIIYISASSGNGVDELKNALNEKLGTDKTDLSAGILANERQRSCCLDAVQSLNEAVSGLECGITLDAVNVSIDYAVDKLLELTGEKARDAVVNEIFSKFCVGK